MDNIWDFSNAHIANMGVPSEDQLKEIQKHAPSPIRAEDVFVFGALASNNDYDSFHSCMDVSTLRNYAEDFKSGRAFLAHHDDKDFPLGRTFNSILDDTNSLQTAVYVTRGLHLNKVASDDFIRAVETGIAKDVSIRYTGGEELCDLCHNRVLSRSCEHMPGVTYNNLIASYKIFQGRAVEMSTVFKGSNPKTSILKARELFQRSLIDEKTLSQWNISHGCDIRSDMERPDIISLSRDLELNDKLGKFFNTSSLSYSERFTRAMEKCTHKGCTKEAGHDGGHTPVQANDADESRTFKGSEAEQKICGVFMDWVQTRGAVTSPENLAKIKNFLERAEKGEHPKAPYDAMQEKVDDESDDNDDHDNEGKNKAVKRHLAPVRSFGSIGEFLKTRSEMTNKAGPMTAMAKGTPDAFSKGHTAGLMYPSTEPLQNAPSETWHLVDGEPIPTEADKQAGAGVASISNPLIEIRPDGTISLLLDGGSKVHGEASVNGIVPMRMEGSDEIVDMPFKSIIVPFRAEHLQELAGLASEGIAYRRSLEFDGIRFGMIRDESRFDPELHLRIMRSLPALSDLRGYVDALRDGAVRKLAVSDTEDKRLSDFGLQTGRQTSAGQSGNPAKIPTNRSSNDSVDDWSAFKI